MPTTSETRKSVHLLTCANLQAFPIWQYADDEEGIEGRDETWVRPVDARAVPRRAYTLVAADFLTSSGREFAGCIAIMSFEEPPVILGAALYDGESCYIVPGPKVAFFDQAMADLSNGLGLSKAELFPITYTLRVPFEREIGFRSGILNDRKAETDETPRPADGQLTFW